MTIKWVQVDPLVMNGEPFCYGSRLTVRQLLELRSNGYDLTRLINDHPELKDFPLAKGTGLPGLGGAKVEVVFADNQGSPATGQNQALRLITEEKVVALTGAYQSGITLTVSAVAAKYGIPFVNGESVAAGFTERGFKWFFRTTPIATDSGVRKGMPYFSAIALVVSVMPD